jgi:hypothetical protein
MCQEVALALRYALSRPPLFEQSMPARGVSDASELDAINAVGAEVAEILSQLTPCGKHPRAIEKSQYNRPDRSLAQNARGTTIGDLDLVFGSNGLTQHSEIDTFDFGPFVGSHEQPARRDRSAGLRAAPP